MAEGLGLKRPRGLRAMRVKGFGFEGVDKAVKQEHCFNAKIINRIVCCVSKIIFVKTPPCPILKLSQRSL